MLGRRGGGGETGVGGGESGQGRGRASGGGRAELRRGVAEGADGERGGVARLRLIEEVSRRQATVRGCQPAFQPAMVALPAEPSAEEKARADALTVRAVLYPLHRRKGKRTFHFAGS